jgi:2-polyprenyl-3-methyl-5-hydroxy-6-metoxy-1,4-benzoquinol methylase
VEYRYITVLTITAIEKAKYEKVWTELPQYGIFSPGCVHIEDICEYLKGKGITTVLDAGTGSGKALKSLLNAGFDAVGVDITLRGINPKLELKGKIMEYALHQIPTDRLYEFIYCTDVMEHIPKELIDLSLERLSAICVGEAYFMISLLNDGFGKLVNETLHVSVLKADEWKRYIEKHFTIDRYSETDKKVTIVAKPICKACRGI